MFTGLESPAHLLMLAAIILLLVGPKRLPEVGRSLGRGIREFRSTLNPDEAEKPEAQLGGPAAATAQVDVSEGQRADKN